MQSPGSAQPEPSPLLGPAAAADAARRQRGAQAICPVWFLITFPPRTLSGSLTETRQALCSGPSHSGGRTDPLWVLPYHVGSGLMSGWRGTSGGRWPGEPGSQLKSGWWGEESPASPGQQQWQQGRQGGDREATRRWRQGSGSCEAPAHPSPRPTLLGQRHKVGLLTSGMRG